MVKKSLKQAIWVGVGVSIGGCILPRLLFKELYNNTWPPIWQDAILYFIGGYVGSFLIFLIINWFKSKL